jgi:two-component system cell cycle response regulator
MAGRLLVADSVATNRVSLAAFLRNARYDFVTVADAAAALGMMQTAPADLIVLSDNLPGEPLPHLVRKLRALRPADPPPILILSSRLDRETRLETLRAGADDVLDRPLEEATLLARIRSLLRWRETDRAVDRRRVTVQQLGFSEPHPTFERQARIAVVSSRPESRSNIMLTGHPVVELDVDAALEEADRPEPAEVFVIQAPRSGATRALHLVSELRSRSGSRHAAILVLMDAGDTSTMIMALDLGANDILPLGTAPEEIALRISVQLERKRKGDHLRSSVDDGLRLAMIDPLTGLYNRRFALANLEKLAKGSDETGRDFCLMIADIDRFKSVNDRFGHQAGDRVLAEVATRLKGNLRGIDMIARIGGEEFLIAMPDTTPAGALAAARRLCALVERDPILPGEGKPPLTVTISIGLAMRFHGMAEGTGELIERADRALYRSKSEGRNKVTVSRTAA